jgi:hypothetical protein
MYYIYKNHSTILSEAKAAHEYTLNQHVLNNEKLLNELHEGYIAAMIDLRNEMKVKDKYLKGILNLNLSKAFINESKTN